MLAGLFDFCLIYNLQYISKYNIMPSSTRGYVGVIKVLDVHQKYSQTTNI